MKYIKADDLEVGEYFSVRGSTNIYRMQWKRDEFLGGPLVPSFRRTLDAVDHITLRRDDVVKQYTPKEIDRFRQE